MDDEQRTPQTSERADEAVLERLEQVVRSSKLSSSFGAATTPRFKLIREIKPEAHSPLVRPLVLAVTPQNNLLVVDLPQPDRFRVRELSPEGACRTVIAELHKGPDDNQVLEPFSVAVDGEHNFYVLDAAAGALKKFSYDGRWLDSFFAAGPDGTPFANPRDFALDGSGGLYVADTNNDRIVKLRPNGELEWILDQFAAADGSDEPDSLYEPMSVAVAPTGRIFVADTNQNRVLCFDGAGKFQRSIAGEGTVEFPSRVRCGGPDESVHVMDQSGVRITRFDPQGRSTGCLRVAGLGLETIGPEGSAGFGVDRAGHVALINALRESISILDFLEA